MTDDPNAPADAGGEAPGAEDAPAAPAALAPAEAAPAPPPPPADPFGGRTRTTTERGPRDLRDARTQTERINGLGPGRFGNEDDVRPAEFDPEAPRRPYRTTMWSTWAGALLPPGSVVHLQPHEIGIHHVPHPEGGTR